MNENELDQKQLAQLHEAFSAEERTATLVIGRRLGHKEIALSLTKLVTVTELMDIKFIKESKSYKGFKHLDENGKWYSITTWDEYCRLVEGKSRESIDAELRNLQELGVEMFDSLRSIGIGSGIMRDIRALPADEQAVIAEAVKTEDKDTIIERMQKLSIKHEQEKSRLIKDKAELEKKLSDATADNEAQGKVLAYKNAKIDSLEIDLHKATKLIAEMTPDEEDRHMQEQLAGVAFAAEAAIRGDLCRAVDAVMERSAVLGKDPRAYLSGALLQLERSIHEIRVRHDIPAVLDGDTRPTVARMLDQE